MTDDRMSKRTDRSLHRAFESVVLTQFPNPERNNCPSITTLRQIAKKRISMSDPAVTHVGSCSPCFAELRQLRRTARRQNTFAVLCTASVALLLLVWGLFSNLGLWKSSPPPPQSAHVAALLDLRNASASRSTSSGISPKPIELRRGLLDLTVYLPVGAESGQYDIQLRRGNETIAMETAQGKIENGITRLSIIVDTRPVRVGEYQIAWRQQTFEWQYYPIAIR
jgi:hypothetical protein